MIRVLRAVAWGLVLLTAADRAPAGAQTPAAAAPVLDREAQVAFLRTAKIVRGRQLSTGVTSPYRLTLSDGVVTHDAGFQSVDERRALADFGPRGVEYNFVDSHHYNLAAYTIAGMVGLDAMMPATVHRAWNGRDGTLTWWIDDAIEERTRRKEKREAPNRVLWAHQMYKMRAFAVLVGDTDRNLGNMLITPDWRLWMIDFTRAFRMRTEIRYPNDLPQVDRTVLARLRALDGPALRAATTHCLSEFEVNAVLQRRDVLVAHFDALIKAKGAKVVLYGAEPAAP